MISTSKLDALPGPDAFRRLTKSLAVLDAIMSPGWEGRYYSFQQHWSEDSMMASMRNGCGDQWFAVLCPAGVALVGLAHEASTFRYGRPHPWVFSELPAEFHANLRDEPAFDTGNSTFCIWCTATDPRWTCGVTTPVDDGAPELLEILGADPSCYSEFARNYYGTVLDLADVRSIYAHEPITKALVRRLNPEADFAAVVLELNDIGYPDAG